MGYFDCKSIKQTLKNDLNRQSIQRGMKRKRINITRADCVGVSKETRVK